MSKQKEVLGAFFKVQIDEYYHTYGRIIANYMYAFYDFKTNQEETDLSLIERSKIIFKILVNDKTIKSGAWKIIGISELPTDLKETVPFFIQEIGDLTTCWIDWNGTRERVEFQECIGLERLAVWDQIHVEKRISDYYNGIPNKYLQGLRLKTP
nr:Imm26 family immunity protein [uncultured Pedobacter sp.]